MYCYYKCSVALPHGAVGWSAVCDCVIYWSNSINCEHRLGNNDKKLCFDRHKAVLHTVLKFEDIVSMQTYMDR